MVALKCPQRRFTSLTRNAAQDAFCGESLVLPGDSNFPEQHSACSDAELAWSDVTISFNG